MALIFITGPTGSGKTDLADEIALRYKNFDIANCDTGQMYAPLNIGTAKPEWRLGRKRYHLFDLLDQPKNLTSVEYRKKSKTLIKELEAQGKKTIFVGGSLFYIKSLLFQLNKGEALSKSRLQKIKDVEIDSLTKNQACSLLNLIDPCRAKAINKNDDYRVKRALEIAKGGVLPSSIKEEYAPVSEPVFGIFINPDKKDLALKITSRMNEMLCDGGWKKEVEKVLDSGQGKDWNNFIKKYLIGYDQMSELVSSKINVEQAREEILKKTLKYAKSQRTFWSKLKKDLNVAVCQKGIKLLEIKSKDQVDQVVEFLKL